MTPSTLDNHLTGIRPDAPHPESYGADIPLRTDAQARAERRTVADQLAFDALPDSARLTVARRLADAEARADGLTDASYEKGYNRGLDAGKADAIEDARDEYAERLRTLERENAALRAQLAQKAS